MQVYYSFDLPESLIGHLVAMAVILINGNLETGDWSGTNDTRNANDAKQLTRNK